MDLYQNLSNTWVDLPNYVRDVEGQLQKLPKVYGSGANDLYMSRKFEQILNQGEDEAKALRMNTPVLNIFTLHC